MTAGGHRTAWAASAGLFAIALMQASAPPAAACGADSDCIYADGQTYRIQMPADHDGQTKVGAIVFMHGYQGSAAQTMANKDLVKAASDLGVALIAPKSSGERDWDIPGSPSEEKSAELDYFDQMLADVTTKFSIDDTKLMASGFSAGGMMTWHLACYRGDKFAGFAPISGTYWAPEPETCPTGPQNVFHYHGMKDRVVPMTGRRIGSWRQGDVFKAMKFFGRQGDYGESEALIEPDLRCGTRKNPEGNVMEICLHPGGHALEPAFVTRAWKRLEAIGAFKG